MPGPNEECGLARLYCVIHEIRILRIWRSPNGMILCVANY